MMYQEVELDLLPPNLRNSNLEARTYFQWEFQFLFPTIWSSGFLDHISRNQHIRVLNYENFMDMTERKWCIKCDGNWCTNHKCPNSYLVFFNPFDRDDETDEVENLELQEELVVVDDETFVDGDQLDQISEGEEEEGIEKEFKEVPDCIMFAEKSEWVCSSDPIIEWELGKNVEAGVSLLEGLTVSDAKPESEQEQNFSQFDLVKNSEIFLNFRGDLVGTEHAIEDFSTFDERKEFDLEQKLEQKIEENLPRNSVVKFKNEEQQLGEVEGRFKNIMPNPLPSNSDGSSKNPTDARTLSMPRQIGNTITFSMGDKQDQSRPQLLPQDMQFHVTGTVLQTAFALLYVMPSGGGLPSTSMANIGQTTNLQSMQGISGVSQNSVSDSMGQGVVSMFEGYQVLDNKPEREVEKELISSNEFLKTTSKGKSKRRVVRCSIRISLLDPVHYVQSDLAWVEHDLVKNVFGFYNFYEGKTVPACVHKCERYLEYKSKRKKVIQMYIICCAMKKSLRKLSRFQFDPGGNRACKVAKLRAIWFSMRILICLLTTLFATDFFKIKASQEIDPVLKKQLVISTILMTVGIAVVSLVVLRSPFLTCNFGTQKVSKNWEFFLCVSIELWVVLLIGTFGFETLTNFAMAVDLVGYSSTIMHISIADSANQPTNYLGTVFISDQLNFGATRDYYGHENGEVFSYTTCFAPNHPCGFSRHSCSNL